MAFGGGKSNEFIKFKHFTNVNISNENVWWYLFSFSQSHHNSINQSMNKEKKLITENELKMDNSLSHNYSEQRRDGVEEKTRNDQIK